MGVWVDRNEAGGGALREDKIAAIGVRLKRWVSFHGISLNVEPDLSHFCGITPCGVSDPNLGVTSLADLGQLIPMHEADGAEAGRTGATNLEDISRNVAGLTIQNLGQSQVAVRGVASGQIVRDQPGVKEQVGVYLDKSVISLSLFTPDIDLYDLNRVETLRGPQGTLFGSGWSVGGTDPIHHQPARAGRFWRHA